MHKAYSVLTGKAFSEDADYVYIEGIASTPTTDRVGDVVEPLGAKFKTPMPLLMNHMHTEPVGQVTFAKATPKGIPFKAQLPRVKEAGRVKDRVDEAIHSLKYALISAVSIGFSAKSDGIEAIKGGIRFKEWDWHELSLVPIPAQPDAIITAIRSFDQPSDGKMVKGDVSPGVSGSQVARKGSVKLIPRNKGK